MTYANIWIKKMFVTLPLCHFAMEKVSKFQSFTNKNYSDNSDRATERQERHDKIANGQNGQYGQDDLRWWFSGDD